MQNRKGRRRSRQLDRDADIREYVQPFIDRLYEIYEETDPSKGRTSESDKLLGAQQALQIWWTIYGKLLLWAQAQIVGYEMVSDTPKLRDELSKFRGSQIDEDSHELELLGLGWSWNQGKQEDRVNELQEALKEGFDRMSREALRRVIVRLHLSTSANSSFWRFPLQKALRAANAGERDEFFEPTKTRRRGNPFQLDVRRAWAISHVYYLWGQGIKKHVAQERVGKALAVSVETLRDWEKLLAVDDWFREEWNAAAIAGELEEEIKEKTPMALEKKYGRQFRSIDHASYFLKVMKSEQSLEKIKADLRRLHSSSWGRKKALRPH
jgi:hypothetical protein